MKRCYPNNGYKVLYQTQHHKIEEQKIKEKLYQPLFCQRIYHKIFKSKHMTKIQLKFRCDTGANGLD